MTNFKLMGNHKFEINTNPSGVANYAVVASGIKNVAPSNNEKTSDDIYLDGGGFGTTDVVQAQLTLSFTGDRDFSDPAQNYIVGTLLNIGPGRRTDFKWTLPDNSVYAGSCTISNITGPTGDAGQKGEIKFEIHFNGKPTLTPAPVDVTAPTVTTVPIQNATAIAGTSTVVWTFSEAIQAALVNDANFFLTKVTDGSLVAGTLSINGANTVVTFTPTASLSAATQYVATATKAIKDVAGNALAVTSETHFTTA